jgi:hypothetical protein
MSIDSPAKNPKIMAKTESMKIPFMTVNIRKISGKTPLISMNDL